MAAMEVAMAVLAAMAVMNSTMRQRLGGQQPQRARRGALGTLPLSKGLDGQGNAHGDALNSQD